MNSYPNSDFPPSPGMGSGGFGLPPVSDVLGDDDGKKKGRRYSRKQKTPKAPKQPSANRMLNTPRKMAILLAIAAVGVGYWYMSQGPATTYVARLTTAVNALTPIAPEQIEVVAIPNEGIEAGSINGTNATLVKEQATAAVQNKVTQYPLYQGSQLHVDQMSDSVVLGKPLGPEERLISIRANVASSVAGGVKAGDHVDIIATSQLDNGWGASVIGKNVEVVKVSLTEGALDSAASGSTTTASDGTTGNTNDQANLPARPLGGTYVLRVPASQAVDMAVADAGAARIYLVYRAPNATDDPASYSNLNELMCKQAPGGVCPTGQ